METACVYFAVRTGSLNTIQVYFSLSGATACRMSSRNTGLRKGWHTNCGTAYNISFAWRSQNVHEYTGYTQKNCAVSKVNKKFIPHLTRTHSTPGRHSPPIFTGMYECFSIVFFNNAGSDVLQKETTTFSLGHPVRRI